MIAGLARDHDRVRLAAGPGQLGGDPLLFQADPDVHDFVTQTRARRRRNARRGSGQPRRKRISLGQTI